MTPEELRVPRRGLLVFNPRAGGRDRRAEITQIVQRAGARGLVLEELPTERPGHATELVARHLDEAPDLVVVCGGDGTLGEAAEALVGRKTPLAILPAGTTNVVAREYGVGIDLRAAEAHLLSTRLRPLTAWHVADRVSLIGAGVGFDARVMGNTVPVLKRLFGRTGIGYTATLEWLKYEFPRLHVSGLDAAGRPFEREATFVLSANTRRYGGDPILSPHADPESDLLELVLFTSRSRADLMSFYHRLSRGRAEHLNGNGVSRLAVRHFTARSLAGYEVEVQVDGDAAGMTPVTMGPAIGRVSIV
ncbi:MAG: diacylglycerol kinase family protein, partial [Thermoanaerobaculia bacterium]